MVSRPLVSLVGIFKNEAASIVRVIESAREVGCDHFTLLDTCSDDSTCAKIVGMQNGADIWQQEPAIPFRGVPSQPIDFAATRNLVLDYEAQREDAAVFTLMLSGDEEVIETEPGVFRRFLESRRDTTEDAFCVTMHSDKRSLSWPSPRVLRVDGGRKYRYPIHEVPVGKNGERDGEIIPGVVVKYKEGDQARMKDRLLNVDLPLLEYMVTQDPGDDHEKHLERARAFFFLGQTHHNLSVYYSKDDPGSRWRYHMMVAAGYYMTRFDLGGDPIDANYALFHALNIAHVADLYTHEEMIVRLEGLAKLEPTWPEVRYRLAFHASQVDPRLAAVKALEAEKVAHEAMSGAASRPTDAQGCLWRALQIQAECAQILKQPALAKRTAERALMAGAPREPFEEYLAS